MPQETIYEGIDRGGPSKAPSLIRRLEAYGVSVGGRKVIAAQEGVERVEVNLIEAGRRAQAARDEARRRERDDWHSDVEAALDTALADFVPVSVTTPLPDIAGSKYTEKVYRAALLAARSRVASAVDPDLLLRGSQGLLEAKKAVVADPNLTMTEHAAAEAELADVRRLAMDNAQWLATIRGASAKELKLIRDALRDDDEVISLHEARFRISGGSHRVEEEARLAKNRETRQAHYTQTAQAAAQSRNPGRDSDEVSSAGDSVDDAAPDTQA